MSIINQAYKKDANRNQGFPVYLSREAYTFYLNLDIPTNDPDFDNFRFDLMDARAQEVVAADIGVLEKDIVSDDFYNIKCSFVFPEDIRFGLYTFRIYDHVNAVVKATSNIIVVEDPDKAVNTAIISFRNNIDLYGVRFEANPDFWMRVRMPIIQLSISQQKDLKQYRNVTNRRLRNLKSYKDEIATIESYYMREETHKAMSCIYDHSDIWMNDYFVVPKTDYTIQERIESIVTKATIDVVVEEDEEMPQSLIDLKARGAEFDENEFSTEFN